MSKAGSALAGAKPMGYHKKREMACAKGKGYK
jgi:hypothetical protein